MACSTPSRVLVIGLLVAAGVMAGALYVQSPDGSSGSTRSRRAQDGGTSAGPAAGRSDRSDPLKASAATLASREIRVPTAAEMTGMVQAGASVQEPKSGIVATVRSAPSVNVQLWSESPEERRVMIRRLLAMAPEDPRPNRLFLDRYPHEGDEPTRELLLHAILARQTPETLGSALCTLWSLEREVNFKKLLATHLGTLAATRPDEARDIAVTWKGSVENGSVKALLEIFERES